MKRRTIITNNREIYEKFNMLNFSSEVVLKDVKPVQIEKILKNINKEAPVLSAEIVGNYIVVKKLNHASFNIYLR